MKIVTLYLLISFWLISSLARPAIPDSGYEADFSEIPNAVKLVKTAEGDVFDCIRIEDQEGLKDSRLNNHQIQDISGFKLESAVKRNFSGRILPLLSLDCPDGTIPQIRSHIKPHKDQFSYNRFGNTSLKFISSQPSTTTAVDAEQYLNVDAVGVTGWLQIWKPYVEGLQTEFSGAFVSLRYGTDAILAGWLVYPALYGDNNPRFTIANTNDQFASKPCFNAACGFVVLSNTIGLGLRFALISTLTDQKYVALTIKHDSSVGGWVLTVNQQVVVGYWPNNVFKYMNSGSANKVAWSGRVANSYPSNRYTKTQMGNGRIASDTSSATIAVMEYIDINGNSQIAVPQPNAPAKCYTVSPIYVDDVNNPTYTLFLYGGSGFSSGCTGSNPPPPPVRPPPPPPPPYFEPRLLFLNPPVPQKFKNKHFRYASYRFTGQIGQPNWDLTASIDYVAQDKVNAIEDQGECNACWAMATGAAFESIYAISTGGIVKVSKQQLLDCAVTPNNGSCGGGWPTDAFELMASKGFASRIQYPYIGNSQECLTVNTPDVNVFKIAMYEEINFYGSFGLLLAVQNQPVVVNLQASSPVFQKYTGGLFDSLLCFTDYVDHSVLVVGYNFFSATKPYWIIRNSFGESWGEKGYMHIAYTGGDGICGMHVTPAYYPVLHSNFGSRNPCGPPNPCGGGNCTRNLKTGRNICSCPPSFVAVSNIDGTQTCAPLNPCQSKANNPCGNGMCVDDLKGSYTCICPPGFAQALFADVNENTCISATSSQRLFYTVQGRDTCQLIWLTFRLSSTQFLHQNPTVNCSALRVGTVTNVTQSANWKNCSVTYTWNRGDSCTGIQTLFNINRTRLLTMNPGLDCTNTIPGLQLCVLEGARIDFDPPCAKFYNVQKGDTCQKIITALKINPFVFFIYNRGINCQALSPQTPQFGVFSGQVCVDASYTGAVRCSGMVRKVIRGDTCSGIIFRYFDRSLTRFKNCNKQLNCWSLRVGTPYCQC